MVDLSNLNLNQSESDQGANVCHVGRNVTIDAEKDRTIIIWGKV